MTVITLTFARSGVEKVAGIPKHIEISSNVPATIYFTMDGSTPTTDSTIYVGKIDTPDNINSLTLSAFGVDYDGNQGPTLTKVFGPDLSAVTVSRYVGSEGFVIDWADLGPNTEDGFGSDGEAARFVDVDLDTLDIIRTDTGYMGLGEGTEIQVNVEDIDGTTDFFQHSTPQIAENFDPYARVITIDLRLSNDLEPILRPYGSLSNVYVEEDGQRIREPADDATYVSGGFVKRFYSAENNVMVSYYFDHNECRYIKNIQPLPADLPGPTSLGVRPGSTNPFVFPWIYRGRPSSY